MSKCPRCGKVPMDHICEMGACELKLMREIKEPEPLVPFVGRRCPENDEQQYIYFQGEATEEFTQELLSFLEEQGFTVLL